VQEHDSIKISKRTFFLTFSMSDHQNEVKEQTKGNNPTTTSRHL